FVMVDSSGSSARLPPQNLAAEQCVLGCLLLENVALDEVADVLHADHFYSDVHQAIYATILRMRENGRAVDAVTLADELEERNQLGEIGGVPYLMEILESVPHAAHVKHYAEIVRDKWIQRSLT